jgi:Dolichyl-phosphate-mannose-protein mannosyltransferase
MTRHIMANYMSEFNKIHGMADPSLAAAGPLGAAISFARRRPDAAIALVLGVHLLVWMLLPILLSPNLQLDLAEDLALGKEWQLGYWKHPPLPWWIADLAYRLVGDVHIVYLLGPLSAVVCMYVVWRLAREVVEPLPALVAVLALEGIHFYNFSVVKFAHDHTLMVFWALGAFFFYHAVSRARLADWMLAGASLAGCFWSKYTAFVLAATLGLVLLIDPVARRTWRTPGPYVMAAAFLVVVAPNLWWLVDSGFLPFRYVNARAVSATHWYQYLTFPLIWTASQVLAVLPAIVLLAILVYPDARMKKPVDAGQFARRYITAIALGPFLLTTAAALVLGRQPIAMWGFALWSFAPLAAVMWFRPLVEPPRLRWFATGFAAVAIGFPVIYAAVELGEPFVRDRPKATQFPGRLLAETITRQWRETTGLPLSYVGGAEFGMGPGELAANNVAVYSPDRPHVVVHGDPRLSPWIDVADLERRGAVLVWQAATPALPDSLLATFPRAQPQPPLVLTRQTFYPRAPEIIYYAFVPPRS